MAETVIYADGWVATVLISTVSADGFYQVYCTTIGGTKAQAQEAAEHVLNVFAYGRFAAIRTLPESSSETNFDTKETSHRGFTRFSYKLEAGEWHFAEESATIPGFAA